MGNKTKKERTQELLKRLLDKRMPWQMHVHYRNKIVMMNDSLICWVAKHFKIDGYVEFDDLHQEGVIAVIDFLDNHLTEKNLGFYSIRFFDACCQRMSIYQKKMMCSLSDEHKLLIKETNIFWEYIRENRDEWNVDNINFFISKYAEEKDIIIKQMPTYFQERVDADEIAVEDEPFEIAEPEEVMEYLFYIANLKDRQKLIVKTVCDIEAGKLYPVDDYEHCKSWQELALVLGLTRERVRQIYYNAIEKMQDAINIILVQKRIINCNDFLTICDNGMAIHYLNHYQYESTFEQDFARAFPDEYAAIPDYRPSSKRRKGVVHKRRSMQIPRDKITDIEELEKHGTFAFLFS